MQFDFSTDTITPDLTTLLVTGGTGALQLMAGTTAQRPGSAGPGSIRWNTSLGTPAIEYFDGTTWSTIGSGGGGSGTVTSVAVSSSGTYSGAITIGSSPITTSGTITITPNVFTSTVPGIVPLSGGGTSNFLRADGTWATPSGSGGGGVTSLTAGTNIAVSGSTGAVTISTTSTPSFTTLAVSGLETKTIGNGDFLVSTTDTSLFRQGALSSLTTGTLYGLVGNQGVMNYWSHNTALNGSTGNFSGTDDTGTSMIWTYDEADYIKIFTAPSVTSGTVPTFNTTPTYSFNCVNGNLVTSGTHTATQYTSTIATGTAPFVVTSTTPVANLSIGGTATNSSNTLVTTTTTNAAYAVTLNPSTTTGQQSLACDTDLQYNPGTDTLSMPTGGILQIGTLTYTPANPFISVQASVNSYSQVVAQNSNTGTTASSDFIVNNNLSTDTTYYGDFGINGGGFAGSGSFSLPNATYLTSTTGDLSIGTTTANAIHFVINGGTTDAFTIGTSGQLLVAGSAGTSGQVLTSGGASAAPSWTTVSGGGGGSLTSTDDTSSNLTYYPASITTVAGSTVVTSSTKLTYNPSSGTFSAVVFNSLSDERAKTNIRDLGYGLDDVLKMQGHKYEMIDGGNTSIGLIAQEVRQIIPEVVSSNVEGMLGINYPVLTAVLIEAIKDLTARIAILEAR